LCLCPRVLVAFDAEVDKGDVAAAWWVRVLPNAQRWRPYGDDANAQRWRPYGDDANAMAQGGADVRAWVAASVQ